MSVLLELQQGGGEGPAEAGKGASSRKTVKLPQLRNARQTSPLPVCLM